MAERAARELLERADQNTPPVDLDAVVSLFPGLVASVEELDHAGYLVDLGQRGGELLVRADDPPARQRFTTAHELGHWLLRDELVAAGLQHSAIERWCDAFAANLLMPRSWLVDDIRARGLSGLTGYVLEAPTRFGVSAKALRLRICEATPLALYTLIINAESLSTRGYSRDRSVDHRLWPLQTILRATHETELRARLDDVLLLARLTGRHADERKWLVAAVPTANITKPSRERRGSRGPAAAQLVLRV